MVRATMIVQMAGKPAEHVKKYLENHVNILKEKIDDVTVHEIKMSEPKILNEKKDVYVCFSEVDFEAKDFKRVTEIVFDFMPSSVEITEPPKVEIDSIQATELLNNISGRLHRYDEIAKAAGYRINFLEKKLAEEKKSDGKSPKKDDSSKVSEKSE